MSKTISGSRAPVRIAFELVSASTLPPGKAVALDEVDGLITARIGEGHMTPELRAEIEDLHRTVTQQERWVQTSPELDPHRLEQPAEGLGIAHVAWERVAAGVLPRDVLAAPVERDRMLVWLLHEDHASAQLCAEVSEYGRRIAGDGLWEQRWPTA
ncbi:MULTISPECIES: hypothetical protein [unclassified Streptomyces]|uniref:hypothetical protein n=1 Tax=Streptomyces TaxID=1883 RepID=UPI000B4FEB20|nr:MULTISPECIES: hypothetical protein [unclassified Streptomyces]MYW99904.1 hypothetical protein [Streptomyces sp. SID8378]SNB89870.1 hypothetical protein SAMN02745831_06164 [Streptomyces sp. PgraA7]